MKERIPGLMSVKSSLAEGQAHADSRFPLHEVDFQPTSDMEPMTPPCDFVSGGAGINFPVGEHERSA